MKAAVPEQSAPGVMRIYATALPHLRISASLALLALSILVPALFGQGPPPPAAPQQQAGAAPLLPPMPPLPINFREFLAKDGTEREKILATRTPDQRLVMERKLHEYEALTPVEREARLCTLGLGLYLRPLMELSPSNRVDRLEAVPQPDRKVVEERLQFWDQMSPEVQKEFLTNEWVLRYILRPETALPNPGLTPPAWVQDKIERGINGWNQLPEPKRQEILDNFNRIFEFSPKQKAKIFSEFSDAERQRMQRTLEMFDHLPKAQRDRCVNGFQRFAGLTLPEREQFLSNVDLWQRMSSKDRQAWQALVSKVAIPAPPMPPPPMPNLPPRPATVATNN